MSEKRNFEPFRCPQCKGGTFLIGISRELIINGGDVIRVQCAECEKPGYRMEAGLN